MAIGTYVSFLQNTADLTNVILPNILKFPAHNSKELLVTHQIRSYGIINLNGSEMLFSVKFIALILKRKGKFVLV